MFGWLRSLLVKKKNLARQNALEPIKRKKAEWSEGAKCPYCGFLISPPPQRKRKCPKCKGQIYVRTDESGRKILMDEVEKRRFDEERRKIAERDALLQTLKRIEVTEKEFERRKQQRPGLSDADILWEFLNERAMQYASQKHWGLYRNVKLSMGEHLMREKRYIDALQLMMEVTILDINGADNNGRIWPKDGFTAPAVIGNMLYLRDQENISSQVFQEMFLAKADELKKNLRLPLSPAETWRRLEKDLKEAESFKNQ